MTTLPLSTLHTLYLVAFIVLHWTKCVMGSVYAQNHCPSSAGHHCVETIWKGAREKSIGLCCLLIVPWPKLPWKKHVVTFPNNKCMTSDHIIAGIKSWFQFLHLFISHWLFSHCHASEPFLSTGNLLFCPCFSCLPCVVNVVYSSGSHLLWWWL